MAPSFESTRRNDETVDVPLKLGEEAPAWHTFKSQVEIDAAMGRTVMTPPEGNPLPAGDSDQWVSLYSNQPGIPWADGRNLALRQLDGEVVFGRVISKGGQGVVWEGRQVLLDRQIAIKQARNDPWAQQEFFKEAFTSAQLEHPNIVPIHDIGFFGEGSERSPLMLMKRVQGHSWRELIARDRRDANLTREAFLANHLRILRAVINAVSYAHSKGIIHRDLKPAQVMVGDYGEVYLLDWGLSVYVGDTTADDAPTTIDTTRVFTRDSATNPAGTPAYMAPEQARPGTGMLGTHTDIYLLGAILYELISGLPPHDGESVAEAMDHAEGNDYPPLPADAPPDLAAITLRCLATNPADRPARAQDIAEVIDAHMTGAGRQAESRAITRALLAVKPPTLTTYEQLSDSMRSLAQATHLWPDNPHLTALRERLLERFVEVALASEDFLLAQIQADRLADAGRAAALAVRIAAAREAAARRLFQQPLLTAPRALALAFALLLVAGAFYLIKVRAETARFNEAADKARSLASLIASELNGRRAEDLRAVDRDRLIGSPEFETVLGILSRHRDGVGRGVVRYVYTLRPEPNAPDHVWRVLVDADPVDFDLNGDGVISNDEMGSPPGNLYESGTTEMRRAWDEGTSTAGRLVDEWGEFISGFAPIVADDGQRVAIVGVDTSYDKFGAEGRHTRRAVLVGFLLTEILVATSMLAFFFNRRSLARIHALEDEMRRQNGQLRARGIYLG